MVTKILGKKALEKELVKAYREAEEAEIAFRSQPMDRTGIVLDIKLSDKLYKAMEAKQGHLASIIDKWATIAREELRS